MTLLYIKLFFYYLTVLLDQFLKVAWIDRDNKYPTLLWLKGSNDLKRCILFGYNDAYCVAKRMHTVSNQSARTQPAVSSYYLS